MTCQVEFHRRTPTGLSRDVSWEELYCKEWEVASREYRPLRCPWDHVFGMVVSTSDYHPRGPGFDSRLYLRNLSGSIGSGTGSTLPREDNWVAPWMRSSEIRLRKLKLRLRDKRFANHKAHCTTIWQQPLQSVLALRGCSATDLIRCPWNLWRKWIYYSIKYLYSIKFTIGLLIISES